MLLLNRRQAIATLGAPLLAQKKEAAPRPNILLLVADQLGAWMLGAYDNREFRTPNLDLLSRTGVRMLYYYNASPVGEVNRASMFTGLAPGQHGLVNPATPPATFSKLPTLASLLTASGYQYAHVGEPAPAQGDRIQHVTDSAVEFLNKQTPGKPFLLTVFYPGPLPLRDGVPAKYHDLYAGTRFETVGWDIASPRAVRDAGLLRDTVGNLRKAAAATTQLDDQIPVLQNKLRERGLNDSTFVVFTAASGSLGGRHGLWGDGLASNPVNFYDESLGVPLLAHWPGKLPVESVRPEVVSSLDLLPTLCEAAQVSLPSGAILPGRSWLTMAQGKPLPKKEPWPPMVFAQYADASMARDNRYKVVFRAAGGDLYDLRRDPGEKVNQFDNPEFVTVKNIFSRELAAWRKRVGA